MKQIIKIAKAELSILFFSPIAWLVIIIYTFQAYMCFTGTLEDMLKQQEVDGILSNVTVKLFTGWGAIFPEVQQYLYLYIPLITMGLMSREYSTGSIKLLYSSPISGFQIVAGKFLSMIIYSSLLIAVLLPPVIYASFTVVDIDIPFILSGLFGLFLLLCAYSAIGLFMSSLTGYQVVAAVSTLAVLAGLNKVGELWQNIYFLRDITYWLSINGRANQFLKGLICSEDVLYFILVVLLFLTFTILRLYSSKVREAFWKRSVRYLGVIIGIMLVGYMSSRPTFMGYYDTTRTKSNTLTENSQEIVKQLKGNLKITSFVNMADDNYWIGVPRMINNDLEHFEQYIRFKPEIETEYIYYYDTPYRNSDYGKPGSLPAKEKAQKTCDIFDMNFNKVLTPEEISNKINLKPEQNSFVRLIERKSGEKTFLRIFDDMTKHPGEREITAAFKRLVTELPKVAFVQGNGERDIAKNGDRDYSDFTINKSSRSALINQGFDVVAMSLDTLDIIPAEIKIVVISDMKTPLSTKGFQVIKQYIEDGGNLLVAAEPNHRSNFKDLLDIMGISMLPGTMVHTPDDYSPSLIQSQISQLAPELSYIFRRAAMMGSVTMPGAVGLDFKLDNKFEIIPVATTEKTGSWNEVETTDFIDDTVSVNRHMGEQERIIPLALALERKVNKKKQHIMILGDADYMSNGEVNKKRKGIRASNFHFTMGIFHWLSNGDMPVDVRRETPPDNRFSIQLSQFRYWKLILLWGIPVLLAGIGGTLRIKRQRR